MTIRRAWSVARKALWSSVACCGLAVGTMASAEEWPTAPINIVAAAKAGGSFDAMARGLAQFLSEELGVPVNVVNKSGGSTMKGTIYFTQQKQDGQTILMTAPAPYMAATISQLNAPYSLDEFVVLNNQWNDQAALFAHKDQPYESAQDLMDAIKANPGEMSVALIANSAGHINLLKTLEAFEIPVESIRIVTFNGGGETRTALAGNQTDFAALPYFASNTIYEFVNPLCIFTEERDEDAPEVPTCNEALGTNVEPVPDSLRSILVTKEFADAYPERFETLVAAYERVVKNEAFRAEMKKRHVGTTWLGPEKSTELTRRTFEQLSESQDILEKYR